MLSGSIPAYILLLLSRLLLSFHSILSIWIFTRISKAKMASPFQTIMSSEQEGGKLRKKETNIFLILKFCVSLSFYF